MKIDISKGWYPDLIPYEIAGGLTDCKNLLPYDEYYANAVSKVDYSSNAVSGTPRTGAEFRASNETRYQFIGTSTKLCRLETDDSLTDVSKAATTYSTGDNQWCFIPYGDWLVALNFVDAPQVLKTFQTTANFVDLGGSPPKAKYGIINNGHLILAYLDEAGTVSPKDLIWSAYESVEDFAESLTTGASRQTLYDADGEIMGIYNIGNDFLIFHKNSITKGRWVGRPKTFEFDYNLFKNIGAIIGTPISIGNKVYFWDEKSIYVTDGVSCQDIGFGWRNTVLSSLDLGYLYRITTAHDTRHGIIYWGIVTGNSADGTPDRIIAHNYRISRTTYIDIDHECLFPMHKGSTDLDSLSAIYPSLDLMPYSMDSNIWLANASVLACVNDTSSKVATFTGTVLTWILETGEIYGGNMGQEGVKSDAIIQALKVRPEISQAVNDVTVSIGSRMNENDNVDYGTVTTVGSNGHATMRKTGRYLRAKLSGGLMGGIHKDINIDLALVGGR